MRLDNFLVDKGLAPSRTRAQQLIKAGCVEVDGAVTQKAAQKISSYQQVHLIRKDHDYVSRGALKLIAGLNAFGVVPKGRVCLDIGASTGGFTEVLLKSGAQKVYAVDVGQGQLHPKLKVDNRVINIEKQNAKSLSAELIPEPIDILVADVSFISLTKALTVPLRFCRKGGQLVCLIKPQFEIGREFIGKGGIVTASSGKISDLIKNISAWLHDEGWQVIKTCPSPILGRDGNKEFLICAEKKMS